MPRIITLTTDFGLADEYVGIMKGVILSRAPEALIVDLSHGVGKQDILQAAVLIGSAYKFFPDHTIHLVVVDPGVGSSRKLILLQADKHLFLAPDNGVLGMLLEPETFETAHEVLCPQHYVKPVSATFHGRDILAPVAAQLAAGLDPAEVGPVINRQELKNNVFPKAKIDCRREIITGEIVGVDSFGNLMTNIGVNSLQDMFDEEWAKTEISVKGKSISGIQKAYAHKAPGDMLAIMGSRGFLEIAVNQGSAAKLLRAEPGEEVKVEREKT